jgi:hypothetical protein
VRVAMWKELTCSGGSVHAVQGGVGSFEGILGGPCAHADECR